MELWFQDEINQLVKEGKKITSIRVFHSNGNFTDIYPPLLSERQKVCDEIIEKIINEGNQHGPFERIGYENLILEVRKIRDR